MSKNAILTTLEKTGLPARFAYFKSRQAPPFIVYMGNGQDATAGDNTFIDTQNRYRIEYYFATKNEENEKAIETALLEDGWLYEKSEDTYIEEEGIFVIYYYV